MQTGHGGFLHVPMSLHTFLDVHVYAFAYCSLLFTNINIGRKYGIDGQLVLYTIHLFPHSWDKVNGISRDRSPHRWSYVPTG